MNRRRFSGLLTLVWLMPAAGLALPLSAYRAQKDDTLDLYVSGSSAQDNTLEQLFRLICEPDTLDIYRSNGGNVRLLFCRTPGGARAIAGIPPGEKLAFHKSSIGGSGSGVGPLIQLTPVAYLNVTDVQAHFAERCPNDKRRHYAAEGRLSAYSVFECDNPTPAHEVPDVGVSDVEPRFFLDLYHLAPSAVEILKVISSNAFIFGVPVTLGLRNALQTVTFAASDPCNPKNSRYAEPVDTGNGHKSPRGETERCMPGFTRAQVAGLFAGTLTEWGQFLTPAGYPLASRDAASGRVSAPQGVTPPPDEHVYICRRVDTSGTQASYEMFFLNQRCAPGVHPFISNGATVFQGSGTADVKTCISELDRKNQWAVGIMSTENVASSANDRWRFVKVDGVAPTLLNTFDGRWPFFVEQSYQWRNERSDHPLKGVKLGITARITQQLQDPAVVRTINRDFRHSWGSSGVMSLAGGSVQPLEASPGKPIVAAAIDENPVLAVTHSGNNCGAVLAQYPTTLH